jgi:hypothetical protein
MDNLETIKKKYDGKEKKLLKNFHEGCAIYQQSPQSLAEKLVYKLVQDLEWLYARKFWELDGGRSDNTQEVIDDHCFMARRQVAYIMADTILENCRQKKCFISPGFFFDYLSSISVAKYKELKAYHLWVQDGSMSDPYKNNQEKYYYEACDFIKACKCERISNSVLKENTLEEHLTSLKKYIFNCDPKKIVKRKSFWHYMGGNSDHNLNWQEAHEFVCQFYDTTQRAAFYDMVQKVAKGPISRKIKDSSVIPDLANNENYHDIANMFEYTQNCFFNKLI